MRCASSAAWQARKPENAARLEVHAELALGDAQPFEAAPPLVLCRYMMVTPSRYFGTSESFGLRQCDLVAPVWGFFDRWCVLVASQEVQNEMLLNRITIGGGRLSLPANVRRVAVPRARSICKNSCLSAETQWRCDRPLEWRRPLDSSVEQIDLQRSALATVVSTFTL